MNFDVAEYERWLATTPQEHFGPASSWTAMATASRTLDAVEVAWAALRRAAQQWTADPGAEAGPGEVR